MDNLLHAAALPADALKTRRTWLLPVLRATMAEIVQGIEQVRGTSLSGLVTYEPNPAVEAQFANYPPLNCPASEAAGFRHDGSIARLVQRALVDI